MISLFTMKAAASSSASALLPLSVLPLFPHHLLSCLPPALLSCIFLFFVFVYFLNPGLTAASPASAGKSCFIQTAAATRAAMNGEAASLPFAIRIKRLLFPVTETSLASAIRNERRAARLLLRTTGTSLAPAVVMNNDVRAARLLRRQ